MEKIITAEVPTSATNLFTVVSDVSVYPLWMDLVREATPAEASDGDAGPAWDVTLTAKVGLFSRSKRLRMVEAVSDAPTHFRLARSEVDGRDHAAWVLDSVVGGADGDGPDRSRLTMTLSYEGDLWSGLLDVVLGGQISSSRRKLSAYCAKRF